MALTVKTDFYIPIALIMFVLLLPLAMNCNAEVLDTISEGKSYITASVYYNHKADPIMLCVYNVISLLLDYLTVMQKLYTLFLKV